jgi:PTH1 family peptidyl-tRNA hydrolase
MAQPQTFMNESGLAVSRLVQYYRVPLDRLMIVCDDMDLPFGTLRLRPSGSSGGQNGLKSIIEQLGTQEFARLRVGVGRPRGNAVDHVLSRFPPDQEALLPRLVSIAADGTLAGLRGMRGAMNEFNRDWLPVLAEPAPSA